MYQRILVAVEEAKPRMPHFKRPLSWPKIMIRRYDLSTLLT